MSTGAMSVDAVVQAYLLAASGDPAAALREVVADALADLAERERRGRELERLVSRGYAREMSPGTLTAGQPQPHDAASAQTG